MSKYIYIQTERNPDLFTVGFYKPNEGFESDSDHADRNKAGKRVRFLNGGEDVSLNELKAEYEQLKIETDTAMEVASGYQEAILKIAKSYNVEISVHKPITTLESCQPLFDAVDRQHKDTLRIEKELEEFRAEPTVTTQEFVDGLELVIGMKKQIEDLQKLNNEVRADMETLGTINEGLKIQLQAKTDDDFDYQGAKSLVKTMTSGSFAPAEWVEMARTVVKKKIKKII